jgi:hypothetical protein
MTGQNKRKFNNNYEFLVEVANVITCPGHKNLERRNVWGSQLQARNVEDIEKDGAKIHTG